jgi:2'-5' RNA ligase
MPLYFVGIVAPARIDERILECKRYMFDRFGCKVALRSPAHITLIPPFNVKQEKEIELFNFLDIFSRKRKSFEVELSNFSAFPPRVIFVNVVVSEQLQNLHSSVEDYMMLSFPVKKSERPFHPHVTIANRDLDKRDFKQAFEYFKHLEFRDKFKVGHIHVLKSCPSGWEVVHEAGFS